MEARKLNPELKEVVIEASLALARLDADRLEELALSCQALNRELTQVGGTMRVKLAFQAPEMRGEMAVFARVVEATRANLEVMHRVRERREGRMEYKLKPRPWALVERSDGNH